MKDAWLGFRILGVWSSGVLGFGFRVWWFGVWGFTVWGRWQLGFVVSGCVGLEFGGLGVNGSRP